METKYLSTDELIKIHDKIIANSGGHKGIINYGNIDFTVSQMNITKTIAGKVAVILFGIIARHPFVDGNKRTGLVATETFLNANNKKLTATEKNLWIVLHRISQGEMNISQIENWIKKNIK